MQIVTQEKKRESSVSSVCIGGSGFCILKCMITIETNQISEHRQHLNAF